jgi:hypothetical protein
MANLFPSISVFLIPWNTGINGVNPAWDNTCLFLILSIVPRMMVRAFVVWFRKPDLNRAYG